ncbi:MAG TPA: rhodanese-like domain-containing protein [Polyangia bacterium]|nr:rhodanese-like domain-containing protein [Polyangia bacterium]
MLGSLARAVALLALGGAVGLAVNVARKDGVPLAGFAPPTECKAELAPPQLAGPDAAAALCGRPDVVIADTRPAARYAEGHVAGAIHLPCDAAGRVASEAMAHLDAARTIIVYGEVTEDALPVAATLRRRSPELAARVMVLRGGFAAWSQAGQACASGPCDDCKTTAASSSP